MAPSISGLTGIRDPQTQRAMRLLWDRINSLSGRPGDVPTITQPLSLEGNQINNVADPVNPQDVVTKAYADSTYGPKALTVQLAAGGAAPLILNGLPGLPNETTVGTHAQRVATPPGSLGEVWMESDRLAIYISNSSQWVLLGNFLGSGDLTSNRPSDLTTTDDSFYFWSIDDMVVFRWTGNVWRFHSGIYFNTLGSRPLWNQTDTGMLFAASDMGYQQWVSDYASAAWIFIGGGDPMRGTISPNQKPGLGGDDTGFLFYATDFDRIFRWNGAAWEDAPGQPERGMYVNFDVGTPAGAGWFAADGGAHTISQSNGTTTSFTTATITHNFYRG